MFGSHHLLAKLVSYYNCITFSTHNYRNTCDVKWDILAARICTYNSTNDNIQIWLFTGVCLHSICTDNIYMNGTLFLSFYNNVLLLLCIFIFRVCSSPAKCSFHQIEVATQGCLLAMKTSFLVGATLKIYSIEPCMLKGDYLIFGLSGPSLNGVPELIYFFARISSFVI